MARTVKSPHGARVVDAPGPDADLASAGFKAARRQKLLSAAETLFLAHGVRATTMESIADAAGISKVTLYAYFKDKDLIFAAVAERLAGRLEAVVAAAIEADGDAAARLKRALRAKHEMVFAVVRRSAFAAELFRVKDTIARTIFEQLDRRMETRMAQALVADGWPRPAARHTARLLFAAADGVATHAATARGAGADIDRLVDALVARNAG